MPPLIDLKKKVFGELTVIRRSIKKSSCALWWCKCSCGKFLRVRGQSLINQTSTSCGCGGTRIKKACLNCAAIFEVPKCRDWREDCCSPDCKKEYRRKSKHERQSKRVRECLYCGGMFTPRQYQLDVGQGKYCSLSCSSSAINGELYTLERRQKLSSSLKTSEKFQASIRRGREHHCFKEVVYHGGYKFITDDKGRKVAEHRFVVERSIGRKLLSDEIVHHDDENILNNSIDNLVIVTMSEHIRIHARRVREQKRLQEESS